MVVPINNNIANKSKPKGNIIVNYSRNLGKIESPLVNPNFGKVINRGSDTNFNIIVNYSTDLTHPELAPRSPVPNPALERIKTINPIRQIKVIGRGIDPEVIVNHPTNINPSISEKEKPTETQVLSKTQTANQTTNLTPQDVLGPFAKAFNGTNLNQILQITNGLTLPKIFNILNQYGININNWKNANITVNGNKIIIEHTSTNFIGIMAYESKNILEIENKDGLIIVKDKKYQINHWADSSGQHKETNLISDSYYVIDPKAKEVLYNGSGSFKSILPELSLIKVLGPIMNKYLGYDPSSFAQKVLQITDGLTLPELFQILGQNPNFWAPSYSSSSFPGGSSTYVANVEVSGNKIIFSNQSQTNMSASNGYSSNNQVVNTLTIEPYNGTYQGKTYHLILVKQKQYNYSETISPHSNPDVYQDTITWYYLINPKTKQVIYKGQEQPQQTQYWLPNPQSGNIISPSQAVNDVLQQYGYMIPSNETSLINSLQPGQSITINAISATGGSASAAFTITYLGNNQYQIQSVEEFYNPYDFNNPQTSINETVTVPTYSYNNGQISTTNLQISGQITTYGTTNINMPYYTATYNVNETIPINYEYNTQTGQLTFWGGNQQGGATLQSIDLPIITTQQLQELQNGQIPPGLKPGWYYNPQTEQIINVSYQTVQQPQVSSQYSYIFYNPNIPYSTTNPKVTQYIAVNTNTDTIYFLNPYGQVLNSISFANTQALNNYLYQNYGITLTNNGPTIITSTSTQTTIPTITTNQSSASTTSLSIPTIISDIWNGLTTIGSDIYSWFTGLFSLKGSTSSSYITNYNYPTINLSNIYQAIQNWETSNYNQYVQTLTKPTYNVPNIIVNTNSNLENNTYQTSQNLQNLELWQEIENNPNYPFPGTNNPYSPFNSVPIITDTTVTWNQIQYETNPKYRSQVEKTKNEVQNWEWGLQTYNFYSDLASLLGLKESVQYYQNLAQQAQQYGSPSFYQAEGIGSIERAIAPSLILAPLFLPFNLASVGIGIEEAGAEIGAEEVGSSILPQVSLSTALTRIGINAAIGAGESVASGEAMSYVTTGKPLSTQQALELAGIGAITGGIAGGFSLFSESANPTLASFGTQFTPLNFAKNLGLNIGGSLIGSNLYSYVTTGEPLSLQQDIYSIEEAGPMTLAYSSIAGILESPNVANRFLKLITSPNSNKYWPIATRVLYDTGANALAGFGSSLITQGIGNLIGTQKGINLEEAAEMALFAGGLTFGFEGFRAFKNPGEFVKSLGYYPIREATINADTIRVIRKGNYDIEITGKGKVPEARPIIGNRIYTEQDFANVKPIQYEFDIGGKIQVQKGTGYVEIPINKYEKLRINLNEPGQTYYGYKGIITTSTEKGSLLSNIEGAFKAQEITNIENIGDYMNLVNTEQEELEKIYPQFKELRNVPKKGYILSRNFLDNRLIPFIQNVNAGQDVLTANINIAEDIAGSRFISLLTSSNYLINQGYISPNEIDLLLGTTSRQYNNLISELENIKQEAYNEIANNALSPETIRATNLKGIDNIIMPEDLKMNMGGLPNPNFINKINRVIYYINAENGEALPNIQYVTISNVKNPYGIESFGFSSPIYKNINTNSNIQSITNRDLSILARLNNADFVRSVSNILNLMRNGAINQDEAQVLLQNEVRQYYNRLNYIKSLNQRIPSNIKTEDSIWQYLYGAKPRNLDLYSNNLNLNNPFNKAYIVGDISKVKTNLGETYKTMGEGIIANSDSYGTGTIFQVMRNNEGKTWFSVQQSTTIPISRREFLTFSYQESVDPNTLMLQAFGREIQGEPLSEEELQIIPKYLGQSKVIAPPVGIIRPYTNYGFSIIGTNQNAININNNYNIGMSRVPNTNKNQLESNMIQNQYIEHPQLNEFNIQNELNVYRNKALESLRQDYLSLISTMNSLQNQFSRDNLYGLKNMIGLQNIQGQSIRGKEEQVERLKARQKEMERQKYINIEKEIIPQMLIEEGLAVGLLLDRGITTKIRPRIPLPPPPKPKPKVPTPPTPPNTPPKEYPPFGFPEITIMGQPIRGLVPGLGRGVRSMFDIQYALSRLQW